jgi:DnaK suppressor protein
MIPNRESRDVSPNLATTQKGDTTMTKTELNKFKQILETKQTELGRVLRNREAIAIEKSPDALDEVQHAAERELAIRNLDRESGLLRLVKGALHRIDDGSYGICQHCEEDINPKRLAAVPWTQYCIRCQEMADRLASQGEEMEGFEEILSNAA